MGSRPFDDEAGSDRVKLARSWLLLQEKYGMVEEDFLSAELDGGSRGQGGGHWAWTAR